MKNSSIATPKRKRAKPGKPKSPKKGLKLNVLLFEPFKNPVDVSFFNRKPSDPYAAPAYSINGRHLPDELNLSLPPGEYLYTRYQPEEDADYHTPVNPKSTNPLFMKAYGFQHIVSYFRGHVPGVVVQRDFINNLVVWVKCKPGEQPAGGRVARYHRFLLNLTMGRYTGNRRIPELLVSYEGESDVLNTPLSGLPENLNDVYRVITENGECIWLKSGGQQRNLNPKTCKPVLNRKLGELLNIPHPYKRIPNRFRNSSQKVSAFFTAFLDTDAFKKKTGLHAKSFFKPEPKQVSREDLDRHPMMFRGRKTNKSGFFGLQKHGPYQGSPVTNPWLLIVAPEKAYSVFNQKIVKPLINGDGAYPGLSSFVHLQPELLETPVLYRDTQSPEQEVIEKLARYPFPPGRQGAVLFLSPIPPNEPNPLRKRQFYRIKEWLLNRGIVSQAFNEDKVLNTLPKKITWWHQHAATALLAKLGGVPWIAGERLKEELIIGVGAFKPAWSPTPFTGSAVSFDNSGMFRGFDFFEGENITHLCSGIRKALRMFMRENKRAERMVIHFYKDIGWRDMQQVMKVFYELNCTIPVYLVTINKTFQQQEVVIDSSHRSKMPINGTYIRLSGNNYLLFNNERHDGEGNRLKKFPFPLKLSLKKIWGEGERALMGQLSEEERREQCTVPDDVASALMAQVIRFSRMYWKSVNPQPLPVTIAYPDMIAKQVCMFSRRKIPPPVQHLPFFL